MFYTRRRLKQVAQGCRSAQAVIRDQMVHAAVPGPSNTVAWGKFLDSGQSTAQVGIYGTAAAVVVIAEAYGETHTLAQRGTASLPKSTSWATEQHRRCVHDAHDLDSVFKLSAALEAHEPTDHALTAMPQLGTDLLGLKVPKGWPDYRGGPAPRLLPTVAALWALRRCDSWRTGNGPREALEYVCGEVATASQLGLGELSFALLVLKTYSGYRHHPEDLESAIETGVHRAKSLRKVDHELERASYDYEYDEGGNVDQKYVFYPTRILVASAILAMQRADHADVVWAVREADRVQQSIVKSAHGVATSGRVPTVDQMWAYRLMGTAASAIAKSPAIACPRPMKMLNSTLRLLVATTILLVVTGGLIYLATLASGFPLYALTSLSILSGGLAATAVWEIRNV